MIPRLPRLFIAPVVLLFLTALCVLFLTSSTHAARNPFVSNNSQKSAQNTTPAMVNIVPDSVLQTVIRWQLELRRDLTRLTSDIKENPWGASFWWFILASLAYGAAHALGPGHGKAFAVAYFLESPGPLSLGLLFGNLSMFCHVASAATLVLVGTYLLETTVSGFVDDVSAILEGVSYGMLACLGLILLGSRLFTLFRKKSAKQQESRSTRSGSTALPGKQDRKKLITTALAAGIAPCPGAALVLMFCTAHGLQTQGLLSLLSISLGMGLTISSFATATILSRNLLLRVIGTRTRFLPVMTVTISIAGGLIMASLGLILFSGWWFSRYAS